MTVAAKEARPRLHEDDAPMRQQQIWDDEDLLERARRAQALGRELARLEKEATELAGKLTDAEKACQAKEKDSTRLRLELYMLWKPDPPLITEMQKGARENK